MAREDPVDPLLNNKLPHRLTIGEFALIVENYTNTGEWDSINRKVRSVSGTAWISFDCGILKPSIRPSITGERLILENTFKVVPIVSNPQTEISFEKANQIKPGIQVGQNLEFDLAVTPKELQGLIQSNVEVINWLGRKKSEGKILVEFSDIIIQVGDTTAGRIIEGTAIYSANLPDSSSFQLSIDGFIILIRSLILTPANAIADIILQLPETMASFDNCRPAYLEIGTTSITPMCELHAENLDASYGPWIVGDTGLVIMGNGYIFDLSPIERRISKHTELQGLELIKGTASGMALDPEVSNAGYLAARYVLSRATITETGLDGQLKLAEEFKFETIHPFGYLITIDDGWLNISRSTLLSGELGPGNIIIPNTIICDGTPGKSVLARFSKLSIQFLDLFGRITFDSGVKLSWGELTHQGSEVIAWMIDAQTGYFFIPSNPLPTFNPEQGNGFKQLSFYNNETDSQVFSDLKSNGLAGITVFGIDTNNFWICSPDCSGGTSNPIEIPNSPVNIEGWLYVGCTGLDGKIRVSLNPVKQLGNKTRDGYLGGSSFNVQFYSDRTAEFEFISNAVFDSSITGGIILNGPCNVKEGIRFRNMEATSTANLVGGDLSLPPSGITLDYWKLKFGPIPNQPEVGVMSVRTGRIIFIASEIFELVHFYKPFPLIWGEILADGDLGELFFSYNSYEQRFDGLPFTPSHISLSKYIQGSKDAYLAVCGTVHIDFFGSSFVNIHDARCSDQNPPYLGRKVNVPKQGDISCKPTDLHLSGKWNNAIGDPLALFDFPNKNVDYNIVAQDGFIGTGNVGLSFLHSDGLDAVVEVHCDAIDIRFSSGATHDIALGAIQTLGGMSKISGCARIEHTLLGSSRLERISFYGTLEESSISGSGILEPREAAIVEINVTTTPSSLDFHAAGDMVLSVGGCALDISAAAHLLFDYCQGLMEGELNGKIDCNTVLAGLSGEGQLTWHIDPSTQYLQGQVKVGICSWIAGGSLEGGLFLGNNVAKSIAWVLYTNEQFGVSEDILPDTLTGLYGYGQVSFGINYWVFGGSIELYAGLGAFSQVPEGLSSSIEGLALPS